MEQKYNVVPKSELRLEGRKVVRGDVANDWGLQLRWVVKKDGKVVSTAPAHRTEMSFEPSEKTPGAYEVVLQTWKYVDYLKTAAGEFVNSKFIDISNVVTVKI